MGQTSLTRDSYILAPGLAFLLLVNDTVPNIIQRTKKKKNRQPQLLQVGQGCWELVVYILRSAWQYVLRRP